MEFIHRHYQPGETIAAIATPAGLGGIAIIRISGDHALDVAAKIFSGKVKDYPTHTVHFGIVHTVEGEKIDEALLLNMRAPRSFTGEDTIELQCHGGSLIAHKVLDAAIEAGARAAAPGEFTFKAYMNGKIDLTQAEAVQRLIHAQSEEALHAANLHLEGALSKHIQLLQTDLTRLTAIVEAWVDFPEEGLEFITKEELQSRLAAELNRMRNLLATFDDGYRIEHGATVCLAGPPNAGKSSLLNALLKKERAIVTPIPGTTRDLISEKMHLGNLHLHLTDTAGIRETDEIIEKEGIRRTKEAVKTADLTLFLLDATRPQEIPEMGHLAKDKTVVLWNKVDLPHTPISLHFTHELRISVKEGIGLDELKEKIGSLIGERGTPPKKDEVMISSLRHKEALEKAVTHLETVVEGLSAQLSPEFLTADLRAVLIELGRIIGNDVSEEILSSIFSQFCIGK